MPLYGVMRRIIPVLRKGLLALIGLPALVAVAGSGGAAGAAMAVAAAVVTDVRVGEHGNATRFVLEINKRVDVTVSTLPDPYRVVVDLPEVGWRLPARPLPSGVGLVRKLRYGLFKRGRSRLVMDVMEPVEVAGAVLLEPEADAGYRLVLHLIPTTRDAFLKRGTRISVQPGRAPAAFRPPAAGHVVARLPFSTPPRKPEPAFVRRTVAIDPGHGGVDPGTIGVSGIYEKQITLLVAREIRERLQATGRFRVVLTRDRDVFVRLRERIDIARDSGAELFISIHADAIKNRSTRGLSVYTLSEKASDKEAAALAEKENKADLIAGIDLTRETPEITDILIDLAQRESMNQSARFAAGLVTELRRETKVFKRLRNTHRYAGFTVLKAPDVPSVLLELGFLSNRQDEAVLRRKGYRRKLASAIVRAVDGYFSRVEEASRP